MNRIYLAFRIFRTLIWINRFNYTGSSYHRMGKKVTEQLTSQIDLNNAPQFPANGKLKMQWYMADSIFACEQFNRLMGQQSNQHDRYTYLLAGGLLTMSDLVIDDVDMDMDRVKLLRQPTQDFTPTDEIEKLYLICYHTFFDALHERVKERAKRYFELLFDAQVRSKEQFNPQITKEQVDIICKEKCGYSTLLLRSLLTPELDSQEEPIWFELGGFIQYCNDAQDLHKDLKNNIRSFASTRTDLAMIQKDLEAQWAITLQLFKAASFQTQKKDDFLLLLYVMYLAVLAKLSVFARVCDFKFSFDRFRLFDAKELRKQTAPVQLLGFILPRAMRYSYGSKF